MEKAIALKSKLLEKPESATALLFASNLLRVGVLQGQLGLKADESATWQEWKEYANNPLYSIGFERVVNIFRDGKVSLNEYIESRSI